MEHLRNLQSSPNRRRRSALDTISYCLGCSLVDISWRCSHCLISTIEVRGTNTLPSSGADRTCFMNATQQIGHVVLRALNTAPTVGPYTIRFHRMGDDSIVNLPVYMLQPAPADIRCEPRRIPLGPNRAPGRAVTPYRHVSDPYRDRGS